MILGVTGGVGAGKSTVLSILKEEYDAYLIVADEVAHRLMEPGEPNYAGIVRTFGTGILLPDGTIDRKALAARVFGNREETARLNALTHPRVKLWIEEEISRVQDGEPGRLIVIEAALLEEGGVSGLCDRVWYVYASQEERVRRIMESRGYDEKRCRDTIARQKSDRQFRRECDDVIDNSKSPEETRRQIRRLLMEKTARKAQER